MPPHLNYIIQFYLKTVKKAISKAPPIFILKITCYVYTPHPSSFPTKEKGIADILSVKYSINYNGYLKLLLD